jgi:hypothetical protein
MSQNKANLINEGSLANLLSKEFTPELRRQILNNLSYNDNLLAEPWIPKPKHIDDVFPLFSRKKQGGSPSVPQELLPSEYLGCIRGRQKLDCGENTSIASAALQLMI